jgi:TMEM175 potassium channel family protein
MTKGEGSGQTPSATKRRNLLAGRLGALSDGVFAIAVTLLVLDIAVPEHAKTAHGLLNSVAHLWPSYLAYIVSFSTIGAVWLGHSAITEYLERIDGGFIRLNLLVLLLVSFLPLPTRLFASYIGKNPPERVAATIYGGCLLLTLTLLMILWRHSVRERLVRPDAGDEEIQLLTRRLTPGLFAYVALIVVGLWFPFVAVGGYLAIALYYIFPFKHPLSIALPRRGQGSKVTWPRK